MMQDTTQEASSAERAPHTGATERPGVFVISCCKCLRSYELHGTQDRLALALLAEGWVKGANGMDMICPRCPCASDSRPLNKSRELARRARRYRYPVIFVMGDALPALMPRHHQFIGDAA